MQICTLLSSREYRRKYIEAMTLNIWRDYDSKIYYNYKKFQILSHDILLPVI